MPKLVAIEALRQFELDLVAVRLAVAREAVGAERDGKRGEPRIVRLVGEPVDAVRQQLREAAGQERVLRVASSPSMPEQHAAEMRFVVALARQRQMAAGLGLEARGVGKGARLGADGRARTSA